MAKIIEFADYLGVRAISIQVSYYPQEDGTKLFCVEKLLPDGTWDHIAHSRDVEEALRVARHIADVNGWDFLPESRWPGHSHLLAGEEA